MDRQIEGHVHRQPIHRDAIDEFFPREIDELVPGERETVTVLETQ